MSAPNIAKVGTRKRLRFSVYDLSVTPRVLADPTTLRVIIGRPISSALAYTYPTDAQVVRDGVGLYHVDYTPTEAGLYQIRGEATGLIVAAEQASFPVDRVNVSAP